MKNTNNKAKNTPSELTGKDIEHIAKLASLPLTPQQAEELVLHVGVTVGYVSQLEKLDTFNMIETSSVNGMENVYREDEVDTSRMLSQKEALGNAPRTHNGFFEVSAVFKET